MEYEKRTEDSGKHAEGPCITVIIPAHNAEETIVPCLLSLCRQDFGNFHAIVVVNGSTDRTGQEAEKIAAGDNRFQICTLEKGDLSTALNYGLSHSTDPLVAFLDADDVYADCFLGNMLHMLRSSGADMAICGLAEFQGEGQPFFTGSHGFWTIYEGDRRFDLLLSEPVLGPIRMTKLYRRELLETIQFPDGHIYEDEYAAYTLYKHANRIVQTDAVWYGYRQLEKSITNRKIQVKNLTDTGHAFFHRIREATGDGELPVARHALQKACADICYRYIQLPEEERDIPEAVSVLRETQGILRQYGYLLPVKERVKFQAMLRHPWILRGKAGRRQ